MKKNLKVVEESLSFYTVLDGEVLSEGKGFNKKDASQAAAIAAVEKLGLV